jgi:hypothetical protein
MYWCEDLIYLLCKADDGYPNRCSFENCLGASTTVATESER